jgi:hypothetical protein
VGLISLIVTEKGTINYPWMLYLLIVSPCDHMPDMKQPKGERIYFGLRCWNPSWQGSVVGSSIQMLGVCHRVCCISDDGRSREQPGWKQGWAITHKPILPCFPLLPGRFHLLQAIKPPEKQMEQKSSALGSIMKLSQSHATETTWVLPSQGLRDYLLHPACFHHFRKEGRPDCRPANM